MWYSSRINFNDPFDCDLSVDIDKCIRALLPTSLKSDVLLAETLFKDTMGKIQSEIDKFYEALMQISDSTGISCFSEENDSILMWGHYANNHKGLCVEYDLMQFNEELNFTPAPVLYSEQTMLLENLLSENEIYEFVAKSFWRKSEVWKYEREWRIIRDRGDKL